MIVVRRFVLSVLLVVSSVIAGVGLAPDRARRPRSGSPTRRPAASSVTTRPTSRRTSSTAPSTRSSRSATRSSWAAPSPRSARATSTHGDHPQPGVRVQRDHRRDQHQLQPRAQRHRLQGAADQRRPTRSTSAATSPSAAGAAPCRDLFKMNVTTGALDTGFAAPDHQRQHPRPRGRRQPPVRRRQVHPPRRRAQKALGTLNATTGVYDPYFTNQLAGLHRTRARRRRHRRAADLEQPAEHRAHRRRQLHQRQRRRPAPRSPSSTSAPRARRCRPGAPTCSRPGCSSKFDTYMTDVEYSPDGSYFVVSTTGAYGGSSGSNAGTVGCDVVARFETGSSTGPTPATWTAYTGGDTTWNVEVTDNVIYAGGHQRWQNNPNAGDAAGAGRRQPRGHRRPQPAQRHALLLEPDPHPRRRHPGHARHPAGPLGRLRHRPHRPDLRVPRPDRAAAARRRQDACPPRTTRPCPGTVYNVATSGLDAEPPQLRRHHTGRRLQPTHRPARRPRWSSTTGAFMVNGVALHRPRPTGPSPSAPSTAPPTARRPRSTLSDAIVQQTDWHNTDVPTMTSLFYYNGRMFFTKSGQTHALPARLRARERRRRPAAVHQLQRVSGINYSNDARRLRRQQQVLLRRHHRAAVARPRGPGTAPVAGTAVQVSGPGKDAQTWNSRSMFVFQAARPADQPAADPGRPTCTCTDIDLLLRLDGLHRPGRQHRLGACGSSATGPLDRRRHPRTPTPRQVRGRSRSP